MSRNKGIIIFTKQFEEKGIVINYLTDSDRIGASFVKGVKKNEKILQIGNIISFENFKREDSLGTIYPDIERSFNAVLSINKKTCGILYCITFLIYTLFRNEIAGSVNLYFLIYSYFEFLSKQNLKQYILDSEQFNYFDIESQLIQESGWGRKENRLEDFFGQEDIRLLFYNLDINHEKFFFYRKMIY